jgi:hypothetical protein
MGLQAEAKTLGLNARALEKAEESRRNLSEELKNRAGGGNGGEPRSSEDQLALARRHPSVFSDSLPAKPQARWPDGTEYARLRLQPGVEPRSPSSTAFQTHCALDCKRQSRSWLSMV